MGGCAHQAEAAEVEDAVLHMAGGMRGQNQLVKRTHQVPVEGFGSLQLQHT